MLDIKRLRQDFEGIKEKLAHRGEDLSALERFPQLEEKRRDLINEVEVKKAKRNEATKQIAELKRNKEDAEGPILETRRLGDEIKLLDEELREVEAELNLILLSIPNIPHESTPIGETEDDNVTIREIGTKPEFDFEPKQHWDVMEDLQIVDVERAGKVTGSRFVFYKGLWLIVIQ